MLIQIKITDYTGRLNHDSYTIIDLEELIKENKTELLWDIYKHSNSKSISRFMSVLLFKSIKNLIKGGLMLIQIKIIDYTGRLNHDSSTIIDLEELIKENKTELLWDIYKHSNSKSISRFMSVLLFKSIKNLIKEGIK